MKYSVKLATLPQGLTEEKISVDKSFIETYDLGGEVEDAKGEALVSIRRSGDNWRLHFQVEGELVTVCDRCLEPLTLPVDEEYELVVNYGDEAGEGESGGIDVITLPYSQQWFDLGEVIRDTILLSLPMRKVHPEGECDESMTTLLGRYVTEEADEEDFDDEDDEMPEEE